MLCVCVCPIPNDVVAQSPGRPRMALPSLFTECEVGVFWCGGERVVGCLLFCTRVRTHLRRGASYTKTAATTGREIERVRRETARHARGGGERERQSVTKKERESKCDIPFFSAFFSLFCVSFL